MAGASRRSVALNREFEARLRAVSFALLLFFESPDLFDDEWR